MRLRVAPLVVSSAKGRSEGVAGPVVAVVVPKFVEGWGIPPWARDMGITYPDTQLEGTRDMSVGEEGL